MFLNSKYAFIIFIVGNRLGMSNSSPFSHGDTLSGHHLKYEVVTKLSYSYNMHNNDDMGLHNIYTFIMNMYSNKGEKL